MGNAILAVCCYTVLLITGEGVCVYVCVCVCVLGVYVCVLGVCVCVLRVWSITAQRLLQATE